MKYAQKVALRDLDREYRRVQRAPVLLKRANLSLDIKRILNNRKKKDQEKVKDYINALHRFMNVRNRIPYLPERLQINPANEPLTPPPGPPPPEPFVYVDSDDDYEEEEEEESKKKRKVNRKKRVKRLKKTRTKKWDQL